MGPRQEAACDADSSCVAYVDNYTKDPPYCNLKANAAHVDGNATTTPVAADFTAVDWVRAGAVTEYSNLQFARRM